LFDLQMGDGEHSAAAETLTILERYGGPQALARRVRIKALAKDRPAVAEALVQIFSDTHDAAGAWEVLDEALASPEWDETIDQAARHSMTQPVPNAGMGDHLIRRYALRGRWRKCEKILAELRGPADLRGWAVNQYLTQLVAKQRWLRLRWYLWRQAGQLRFSTPSWGAVGYAKLSLGDINGTIRWLGDWRERGDGMPWMLTNLADALHIEGRSDQARDVHEVATQRPDDHTTAEHQAWLAALDAMENRFEAASKRLEQTDLNRAMPSARFVAGMARFMVQTDALKTGASSQQIESIFATLRQAEQELPHYTQQQHLKRLRRAALRRLIPFAGWRARRAWLTSML